MKNLLFKEAKIHFWFFLKISFYLIWLHRCIVLFDGDEIVQIDKKVKKDKEQCEKFEKAKVCISKHEDRGDGIYACQLAIEDMNEDLEGDLMFNCTIGQ